MIRFLLRRPIAVFMAFTALFIIGIVTYKALPVSLLPDIAIPEITVQVTGENTSARELENTVMRTLRAQLMQVGRLEDLQSETRDGIGLIRLRFEYGTNIDLAFIEVNEKTDAAMSHLPRNTQRPRVIKASATDIPVLYLNLTAPSGGTEGGSLSDFAENVVRRRIEQLPEVAMVDISGLVHQQVQIQPDLERMESMGIGVSAIESALANSNVEPGSMTVRDGYYEYNIRFSTVVRTVEDVRRIPLRHDGRILQLGELADVRLAPTEETGMTTYNGRRAVSLAIIKQADENMDRMKEALTNTVRSLERSNPHVQFDIIRNQTELLDYTLTNLQQNLTLGFLFILIVASLFMGGVRSPLVIGICMVVALVISFIFFYLFGMSLNIISLSGLILAEGMMIDNAIIVTENITQYRDKGYTLEDACTQGTNEVITPMLSSSLTTIAVFFPLVFISGIAGAIFMDEAFAVTVGLVASYITGIVLLPVLYKIVFGLKLRFKVQGLKFKVQDEVDATRRGTPCGYPNETANINHWAPTRDAPTVNEKQSASSVDEESVPHGNSSLFTLHSSLNQNSSSTRQLVNLSTIYDRGIHWVFSHKRTTLGMAVLSIPLCVLMFYLLPKERMPETSRTELAVRIDWNENIHLEENRRRTEELERFCKEGVQGSKFKVQDEADANRRGTPCGHPNETVNINHWAPTRDAPTVNEKQSASSVDEESVPHGNSSFFTFHSSLIIESQAHIGTRQYLLDREQTSTSETDLYLRTATADGPALLQTAISSWMATHYPQATVHFYAPENVFEKVFDTNEPQLVVELYNSDKARLQEVDRLQALQQMVDDAAGEASEGLAIQEQIGLTIDRERLLLYGVSYDEIVRTLKTALRENKVATLRSYQNYLPISISGQEQTLDEILTHTLIEVPSSVRGERQRVPLRSFITTFPAKDLKTITAGMAGEYVPLVYTDTRQAEKIVEKVKKGVFGNEERRVKSEELVQSSRFKVQDEADASRRGTPCGYPNETANINHWAPTRDAPTVNEKQSASSVDEGTVPHGHSSLFTLHSSLNGATWSPSFSGAFFSSHRMIDELVVVLFISLLLMYFILAAQFESFLQPLIVLAEIPIDLGFALVVMAICGVSLNLMSAIGIVVSCGIIINDSILKLDMINVLRKEGVPLMEAIHTAGTRRLRSIIMTSLTTILAMVPLLFTHDLGSELQTPLAIAMIATMTVGTLVSLFVIPLVYWGVYRRPSPSLNGGE